MRLTSTHNISNGEHSLLQQGLCISQESSEGDKEVKYNRNLLKSALIHPIKFNGINYWSLTQRQFIQSQPPDS